MGMQLIWITTSPSSTRHEKALFPYKAKTTAMGGWTSQIGKGCQYPLEADHQLWVAKATLAGKMKSCMPKCHQRALLKVGNLEASAQTQDILTRHLFLGT
ncbi:hypothetical protein AAG906_026245 [Vitis piasezkii]